MTPSWPAAPPLASCVTSTGHSTSLGFRHLPNKKAGPPSKGGANRDPVGPWRPLQGLAQGQHWMGKLRPVMPRSQLLKTRRGQSFTSRLIQSWQVPRPGFRSAPHTPARGCLPRCAVGYFILQPWKHGVGFTTPAHPTVEPALNPFLTRLLETKAESLVRTSLAVQCLRPCASNAGGTGSIPG